MDEARLFANPPKPIINPVREFICTEMGPFRESYVYGSLPTSPLQEDHALQAAAWAQAVHRTAARAILDQPEVFPRGSIGFAWARKILDPGLAIVQRKA